MHQRERVKEIRLREETKRKLHWQKTEYLISFNLMGYIGASRNPSSNGEGIGQVSQSSKAASWRKSTFPFKTETMDPSQKQLLSQNWSNLVNRIELNRKQWRFPFLIPQSMIPNMPPVQALISLFIFKYAICTTSNNSLITTSGTLFFIIYLNLETTTFKKTKFTGKRVKQE